MDVGTAIKTRLRELGFEQKDLAAAAGVTDSYVSQLLTWKKLPPAPDRTDLYTRMEAFLALSNGELATLARAQRREQLQRDYGDAGAALLQETRALLLRKCIPAQREQLRTIFERQPFGELERLITQKLLDVVRQAARAELDNEAWLREVARHSGRTDDELRLLLRDFLDTDIYHVSNDDCVSFLDPLIAHWSFDVTTFDLTLTLNERLLPHTAVRFSYDEQDSAEPAGDEPGFRAFLEDARLAGDASADELAFLRRLRFGNRRPGALFYYRTLQALRDPLHFTE